MEFTCIATGHPYPDYTWWHDNRLINSDSRITVSNGGQHLRIQNVKLYDDGDYVCRAENRLGRAEVSARLDVVALPKPLSITVGPHDMEAPEGATVQLPCSAEGSPQPEIHWTKDGLTMEGEGGGHFRVTPTGSLVMFNVSDDDEGVYECVAENGRERRTARAVFRIRDEGDLTNFLAKH